METTAKKTKKTVKKSTKKDNRPRLNWSKFVMPRGTYAELVPDPFNLGL